VSWIVAVLATLSSASGLLRPGLYRDNALVTASWYGNDLVTLGLAVPLLAGALIRARRGSMRATLLWLGMLLYTLYNYAFYLFGAAFNSLFFVYAALYTLSAFALVFGLLGLDVETLRAKVRPGTATRCVAAFITLVGVALAGFYTMLYVAYLSSGEPPALIDAVGGKTNLIGALDLSMVVSVAFLGGAWLWQRRPWGYVLAVLWNVKGAVYMLALSAATTSTVVKGPAEDWTQLLLWGPIGLGCFVASLILMRNIGHPSAIPKAAAG
jgi:hypothetical protein